MVMVVRLFRIMVINTGSEKFEDINHADLLCKLEIGIFTLKYAGSLLRCAAH